MPERDPAPVRLPALMLGCATVLWGWHQSLLVYAVAVALVIELARVVPFRWDFDDKDFHRLGDVTGIGLVLLAIVQFSDRGLTGIYGVLRWFPMVVLALTLAQMYSTRRAVKLSAMFLSVRYALRRGRIRESGELDMRTPYLVACMLSASAGPERSDALLPAQVALLVWLLWVNRPRAQSGGAAVAALLVCAAVAVTTAASVGGLRRALGPVIMDIVRERVAHWRDPFQNHTALGEIGRLKLSDRIALRVESPPGVPVPDLLHEAVYTHLSNNVWLAGAARFKARDPEGDGTRWDLAPEQRPFRTVTIARSLIRNKGMLALPSGAFRIDELPVEELEMSVLGALKVLKGPALVRYRVRYANGPGVQSPPGDDDLAVPQRLDPVIRRTLARIGLDANMPARAVAGALVRYFGREFRYSLDLKAPTIQSHPIEEFLERGRAGHCEFFATSAVLLLRAAGIPARYATGYSVQEYSPLEDAWLVRRRHAHAWASAWIDGRWVDVDATPVQWVAAEAAGAAWWESGYDVVSWLLHRFSRWRLERSGVQEEDSVLSWLLLPLSLILAWRVYHSRRVGRGAARRAAGASTRAASGAVGSDSEFYRIEAMLRESGLARPPDRTPLAWLRDLSRAGRLPAGGDHWREIVALHYRLRFDPAGLDAAQRERLAESVMAWLNAAAPSSRDVKQVTL